MSDSNTIDTRPTAFHALRSSNVALLTSFRPDGRGVGTPVSINMANGKIYFTTWSTTAKIKRIAHQPRVMLAPCTPSGRVTGATVEGIARRLEAVEAEQVRAILGGKIQRWLWNLIYKFVYRAEPVLYEVAPVAQGPAAS
jgi:uncharacterized protein